jgi:hypothetical protein
LLGQQKALIDQVEWRVLPFRRDEAPMLRQRLDAGRTFGVARRDGDTAELAGTSMADGGVDTRSCALASIKASFIPLIYSLQRDDVPTLICVNTPSPAVA